MTIKSLSIYEQDLYGKTHYRIQADCGSRIFSNLLQLDAETEAEALRFIRADWRRKQLPEAIIRVYHRINQKNRVPVYETTTAEISQ